VPLPTTEPGWDGGEEPCEACGASRGAEGAVLAALGLHSARARRCLGGRRSLAAERTSTSGSEPDEWRMRGRRLFAWAGVRWAGVLACGIHSSDRSSSHGWVVLLAMAVSSAEAGGGVREGGGQNQRQARHMLEKARRGDATEVDKRRSWRWRRWWCGVVR